MGQNLIRNGDFSSITVFGGLSCTNWRGGFEIPTNTIPSNWYSPQDSSNLLIVNCGWHCHACQDPWPQGFQGAKPGLNPFPTPKKGLGYAQLNILKGPNNLSFERGFISQKLQAPLLAGETYTIEFYVRTWKWSMKLCSNLGVLFTADSLDYFAFKQNLTPDFEIGYLHSDTTQWTRILGTYVANGTESFFNMGNFRHDTATTTAPSGYGPNPLDIYNNPSYLIDAVMLYRPADTLFTATLPPDTLLCPGQQLVLQPILDGFKLEDTTTAYLWSTGSTDSSIVVTQPGTYWVQTTINSRFVAGDTMVVDFFPANYTLSLPDTVTFCEGTEAVIQAAVLPAQYALLTAYFWNTGSTLTGIAVRNSGLYWLNAQTPCYNLADSTWAIQDFCESYLWVPNAFTPDGDGTNDYFEFQGAPQPVKLSIYDRWGTRVFYSDNYQNNWDGTYQGQDLQAGVYTYLIEYLYINPNATQPNPSGSERQVRGTVSILR